MGLEDDTVLFKRIFSLSIWTIVFSSFNTNYLALDGLEAGCEISLDFFKISIAFDFNVTVRFELIEVVRSAEATEPKECKFAY